MGSALLPQLGVGAFHDAPGRLAPGNLGSDSELPEDTQVMQL